MTAALAYFNWSRWVVDCPQPGCTDAREVKLPTLTDVCSLGHPFEVVMPPEPDAVAIEAEVMKRPHQADQSWYPSGHIRAMQAGLPTGQTLVELQEETAMVEQKRAAQQAERDDLAQALARAGITVGPDGHFEGHI